MPSKRRRWPPRAAVSSSPGQLGSIRRMQSRGPSAHLQHRTGPLRRGEHQAFESTPKGGRDLQKAIDQAETPIQKGWAHNRFEKALRQLERSVAMYGMICLCSDGHKLLMAEMVRRAGQSLTQEGVEGTTMESIEAAQEPTAVIVQRLASDYGIDLSGTE